MSIAQCKNPISHVETRNCKTLKSTVKVFTCSGLAYMKKFYSKIDLATQSQDKSDKTVFFQVVTSCFVSNQYIFTETIF